MAEDATECEVNVQVAVRCRPLNGRELAEGSASIVEFPNDQQVILNGEKGEKHQYAFDHIFSPTCPQENVFKALGVALLDKAFEGYNSTIFAYGQTGSGKTHTMLAHRAGPEHRGLIPRIADSLYQRINGYQESNENRRFLVQCSFLEIYNEVIYDLLIPRSKQAKGGLEVREQKGVGVYVKDLSEMVVDSAEKLCDIIEKGFDNRSTAATKMNDASSRSHCIFIIKLHQKDAEDDSKNTFSKLNLVDLAGSERQKSTEAQGQLLKEGANINKSLSALGNVINALSAIAGGNKKIFVPYRNSKLTRVLQESLGGNSLCTMVATMSPSASNLEETLSTLNYAKRAKTIKVTATKNDEASQVKKLEEEVAALRRKLESQSGAAGNAAMSAKEKQELEEKFESQINELQGFMKQSWEEKKLLSEKHEKEQQKMREEAERAAEQVRNERQRRLQLLEQDGNINLILQAIKDIGSGFCTGWPEKISDALRLEQQLRQQLHAVRLYRDSAASDFKSCASCVNSDAIAIQTLLNQVHTKLKEMKRELEILAKLEVQLEEQLGRILPEVAVATREAQQRGSEQDGAELVDLLKLIQRQVTQHHAETRAFTSAELQKLGMKTETEWLQDCFRKEEAGGGKRAELLQRLQVELSAESGTSTKAPPADAGGLPVMLGLSTNELPDSQLAASTNGEYARCARLLQITSYAGWCPGKDSPEEYFEVLLGEVRCVTGISLQGREPCTKDWQQTRDLLQLALGGVTDKVPSQEKILKRPPVRLVHEMGVALLQDVSDVWKVPPELMKYADLDREQKMSFFDKLISGTNQAHKAVTSINDLTITPQDILAGKNCDEANRLLQMLSYLRLRSMSTGATGGLFHAGPQWTKAWKLRYYTEQEGWSWYKAPNAASDADAQVFEGNEDATNIKFVSLPQPVRASKLRLCPTEWHQHPALRLEIHVAAKADQLAKTGGPQSQGAAGAAGGRRTEDLRGWVDLVCEGIEEVKTDMEARQKSKQKEEEAKVADLNTKKDKAEAERDLLETRLQDAVKKAEELEAVMSDFKQRAAAAETQLLQTQVERDRLASQAEQLDKDLADRTKAKTEAEAQCVSLEEEKQELQVAVDDLTSQLQVMTEERDLARDKEVELFDTLAQKEEELMDTNNGYCYLTERCQEKEEEMEQIIDSVEQHKSANAKLDQRCKELSEEMMELRREHKTMQGKLADAERAAKMSQERYMKVLKDGMGVGGSDTASPPPTATTRPGTSGSGPAAPAAAAPDQAEEDEDGYKDDFDECED